MNHRYRGRCFDPRRGRAAAADRDPHRSQVFLRYVEILKEEIAADPGDTSRLDFLAAEYHQLEMFEHATAVAEHIALLRPLDPRAHLFVGVYHLLYKPDLPRARADFMQALKLRPGYAEAESFLGLTEEYEQKIRLGEEQGSEPPGKGTAE